ncbi:hypothetical protein GOBAR_AA31049 [Gossypium barbadense]|uniref:Uncharacterized protein n=1 Tax=Gossypium barbadense TaxID=3634 RepID=A0A2P5WEZ8_GOSBA|nr:hypothetical protein GOBAR_AA31049 [Gossypium barbadense]
MKFTAKRSDTQKGTTSKVQPNPLPHKPEEGESTGKQKERLLHASGKGHVTMKPQKINPKVALAFARPPIEVEPKPNIGYNSHQMLNLQIR